MSDGEFEDFGYDFDDFGVADLSPEDFGEELAGLSPEMLAPEDIFGGEFDAPAEQDVDLQVQDYSEGQLSPLNVNPPHQPVHLPRRPEKTSKTLILFACRSRGEGIKNTKQKEGIKGGLTQYHI